MKTLMTLILLFTLCTKAYSEENLKLEKYEVLKFIGPNTNPQAAAKYSEKKYTIPAYKIAVNAYKQLKNLAKKKELSQKQLKLSETFKNQIRDYKLWLKLTKLYHAAHFAAILQPAANKNIDRSKKTRTEHLTKNSTIDPITKDARSISIKISNKISSFFEENKHLTEKKGFIHPARASYSVFLRNPMEKTSLDQKLRKELLDILKKSIN